MASKLQKVRIDSTLSVATDGTILDIVRTSYNSNYYPVEMKLLLTRRELEQIAEIVKQKFTENENGRPE